MADLPPQVSLDVAAQRLGVHADTVAAWVESGILSGQFAARRDKITVSEGDLARLRSELYGVPDLVFESNEGAVPAQDASAPAPSLALASQFVVALRTTSGDTVYPEVTIERRSHVPGRDSWAICWSGNVFDRDDDFVWDTHHGDTAAERAALDHRRYRLAEAFAAAPRAIAKARETIMPRGAAQSIVSLLDPPA